MDRKGPEIFVGEWAAHEDARRRHGTQAAKKLPPTPSMKAAIGDAAFMAAMERNSDIIKMQCYAPLLVNVNPGAWQWRPDLIGYDALSSYGSPSYYAFRCSAGMSAMKSCRSLPRKPPSKAAPRATARPAKSSSSW